MLHTKFTRITNAATWYQIFCLQTPPPPHLGMGLISQSSCFIEQGLAAYQIKGNHEKQHHACKYFARRLPSLDPGDGVNRSKFNFFRNGHVEYQIKGNHECTRHGCRYFSGRSPYPPPPPLTSLGGGRLQAKYLVNRSKFNFFRTRSCCISN